MLRPPSANLLLPIVLALFCLLVGLRPVAATVPATSKPTSVEAPAHPAAAPANVPASQPDDHFNPGLGIAALFMMILLITVTIIGVVLALIFSLIAAAIILILLTVGILSLSMLYGFLKKSVSAAAKALIILAAAVLGIPVGIVLMEVLTHLLHWPMGDLPALFLGALCGIASGALGGYVITRLLVYLLARITRRLFGGAPVITPSKTVDVTPAPPQ